MAQQWGALFGAEVRLKRVRLGLATQQALAERLGYKTHATITQIEMGNVAAHFDVALELARYLQIDLNAVMGIVQAPTEGGAQEDWFSEMFMVRFPTRVYELWPLGAQQEILVRMVEAMAQAMRETMQVGLGPGVAGGEGNTRDVRVEAGQIRMGGGS